MSRSLLTRTILCSLLALTLFTPATLPTPAPAPAKTVIFVRHAERAPEPPQDPLLSDLGRERAIALAHVLERAGVAAIFTSEYSRTRQTAAPIALKLGVTPKVVSARDPKALLAEIHSSTAAVILVIGHSNTLAPLIRDLGAGDVPAISEDQYDNLFVVTLFPTASTPASTPAPVATLLHLKFGAPPPAK